MVQLYTASPSSGHHPNVDQPSQFAHRGDKCHCHHLTEENPKPQRRVIHLGRKRATGKAKIETLFGPQTTTLGVPVAASTSCFRNLVQQGPCQADQAAVSSLLEERCPSVPQHFLGLSLVLSQAHHLLLPRAARGSHHADRFLTMLTDFTKKRVLGASEPRGTIKKNGLLC